MVCIYGQNHCCLLFNISQAPSSLGFFASSSQVSLLLNVYVDIPQNGSFNPLLSSFYILYRSDQADNALSIKEFHGLKYLPHVSPVTLNLILKAIKTSV